MATLRTDDPIADFNRIDRQQAAWLESRPKCIDCGEPIQNDYAYNREAGYVCQDCMHKCMEVLE